MLRNSFKVNYIKNLPIIYRNASETRNKSLEPCLGLPEKPNESEIKHDWIGPPDKISNIRPILRHIPENETPLQKKFRLRRVEVLEWTNEFWKNHNKRFYDEKEDFIKLCKKSSEDTVNADRMSIFYKQFLDKNRKMHVLYNISWYLKNFELLFLAIQVNIEKSIRWIQRKK